MARKNPFGKITETALSSIKNPGGTSGKVVERAKGTAALGKMVAEQVGRSAVSKASGAASAVVDRAKRRKSSASSLRSVPVVNEPGHTPAENEPPGPVHVTAAEESPEPRKVQGDPVPTSATAKTPTKASSAKKSSAPSPADVAQVVESAVAEDPKKTAATPAEATGTQSAEKKASPGETLPPAKKTAAKKTAAKKTTAKKTTAKKTAAKKSPTKKAASKKTPTEKSAEANPE